MAAQKHLKLVAVLTVLIVYGIMGIVDIMDNFQANAAQKCHSLTLSPYAARAQHECKSDIPKCDPNAYCYGNDTSYECMCISDWDGDGFVGDGHVGCQRRQVSKSQLATFILAFILAGLVIVWFSVDAILGCIRLRARIRNNAQVVLAQQAHLHQGVALAPIGEEV